MERDKLVKELDKYILDRFVNFSEYQNKYFLKKKIQEIMPDITDDKVYNAIEITNKLLKQPSKKKTYISFLSDQLLK